MLSSIHYFAAVLHYEFEKESYAYKYFVIKINGPMLLPFAFYLGYRESIKSILFYRTTKFFYLKAFLAIIYHILYYGPTYYIVIRSLIEIDY